MPIKVTDNLRFKAEVLVKNVLKFGDLNFKKTLKDF